MDDKQRPLTCVAIAAGNNKFMHEENGSKTDKDQVKYYFKSSFGFSRVPMVT